MTLPSRGSAAMGSSNEERGRGRCDSHVGKSTTREHRSGRKETTPIGVGTPGSNGVALSGTCEEQGNRVQLGLAPAGTKTYSQSTCMSDSSKWVVLILAGQSLRPGSGKKRLCLGSQQVKAWRAGQAPRARRSPRL